MGIPRTIIMLSGWMQSGKDTVGSILCKNFGFQRFAFADMLKDEVSDLFNLSRESLDTSEGKAAIYDEKTGKTVRDLLISHGQQRRAENINYWVERVIKTIEQKETHNNSSIDKIVITDWRFPNEFQTAKLWSEKDCSTSTIHAWRINRWKEPPLKDVTELALDDFSFDATFDNSGTVNDLYQNTCKVIYSMKDHRVKILLVDVDEVLLRWIEGFSTWIKDNGYTLSEEYPDSWNLAVWIKAKDGISLNQENITNLVLQFNHSTKFEHLAPCKDAVHYLKVIKRKGYHVVAISSCTEDPDAVQRRKKNLKALYNGSIDSVICLGLGACKKDVLMRFPPSIWIDDNPINVRVGKSVGHASYIMKRPWNTPQLLRETKDQLDVLDGWKDVEKLL